MGTVERGKKTGEISLVDCLRLKRNYAWWLFSGRKLIYDEFKRTSKSPVLHHFNNHSTCGSWCKHTKKCEEELKTLKKYRSKETNAGLYLLCSEIIERFSQEANLRECHHRMHSQKNEAMNRSIMRYRYCPKEKTYSRTMSLTSRIALAVGIDTTILIFSVITPHLPINTNLVPKMPANDATTKMRQD
jgi:hypothetical protein